MTHRFRTLSIGVLPTALAFALSTPAVATPEDTVTQILQITPGVSRDELVHAASDWASENGTTLEESTTMFHKRHRTPQPITPTTIYAVTATI